MNKLSKAVSKADRIYYIVIDTFLILMLLAILYPLYFIVIASISDTDAIFNGEVFLYPIGFNLKGYAALFENRMIWTGYLNTIWYTLLGTAINIAVTIPAGWAISRKELPWRKFITTYFIVTMFFGGGLIPFYLLVSDLGLLDNPLSVILPYGVSVWNMFMVNAFIRAACRTRSWKPPKWTVRGRSAPFSVSSFRFPNPSSRSWCSSTRLRTGTTISAP